MISAYSSIFSAYEERGSSVSSRKRCMQKVEFLVHQPEILYLSQSNPRNSKELKEMFTKQKSSGFKVSPEMMQCKFLH